jgi:hypothetical protein
LIDWEKQPGLLGTVCCPQTVLFTSAERSTFDLKINWPNQAKQTGAEIVLGMSDPAIHLYLRNCCYEISLPGLVSLPRMLLPSINL